MHTSHSRGRPLLSLATISNQEFEELLDLTRAVVSDPRKFRNSLNGARVCVLFTKTSTRTRSAFWRASVDLGAEVASFGPNELQLATGETWRDTGKVLSQYFDAAVIRTNGPVSELEEFAEYFPTTINALTDLEHPTQALSDLATLTEHFGDLNGLRVAYVGDGNSTATALALLLSRMRGVTTGFFCPAGFQVPPEVQIIASRFAAENKAEVVFEQLQADTTFDADVVYTTRWATMGVGHEDADWKRHFATYCVEESLAERLFRNTDGIVMHDLPAVVGEEITADMLYGPRSIAFRQAFHKTTGATVALLWCNSKGVAP